MLLAVACTRFPELEATISPEVQATPYPNLVPVEPILAAAITPAQTEQTEQSVQSRADALRRRADRLRGRVIDRATRARMANGVTEG